MTEFKLPLPFILYKDKYNLPVTTTIEFIEEFQEMNVRSDDVFIVTYPKSGTHWMQEIVHLIFADGRVEKVSAEDRRIVVEMVDVMSLELVSQGNPGFRLMENLPSPRVFSTHVVSPLLPRMIFEKKCKVIYVYRHPKDVVVSFYNFFRVLSERYDGVVIADTPENFDRFFQSCLEGQIEYGSWFDHILGYNQHTNKNHFLFVSYENMKKDIHVTIRQIGKFLGRELKEDVLQSIVKNSSFKTMKETFQGDLEKAVTEGRDRVDLEVFLNKGEVNQWKERFTREQNEKFDKKFLEKMKNCNLTKSYKPSHIQSVTETMESLIVY